MNTSLAVTSARKPPLSSDELVVLGDGDGIQQTISLEAVHEGCQVAQILSDPLADLYLIDVYQHSSSWRKLIPEP